MPAKIWANISHSSKIQVYHINIDKIRPVKLAIFINDFGLPTLNYT